MRGLSSKPVPFLGICGVFQRSCVITSVVVVVFDVSDDVVVVVILQHRDSVRPGCCRQLLADVDVGVGGQQRWGNSGLRGSSNSQIIRSEYFIIDFFFTNISMGSLARYFLCGEA